MDRLNVTFNLLLTIYFSDIHMRNASHNIIYFTLIILHAIITTSNYKLIQLFLFCFINEQKIFVDTVTSKYSFRPLFGIKAENSKFKRI